MELDFQSMCNRGPHSHITQTARCSITQESDRDIKLAFVPILFPWWKRALIWPSTLLFYRTTATEGNRCINISRQHQTPPIPHVQLVLLLRPFKTQQRVTKWCSVSLIELRPINNKSLAVALLFLVPGSLSPPSPPFRDSPPPVSHFLKIRMEFGRGIGTLWGEYSAAASATTPEAWLFWRNALRRAKFAALDSKHWATAEFYQSPEL